MTQNTKRSFIKEAEQNAINQAKFWSDFCTFIDDVASGTMRRIDSYDRSASVEFDEGFHKVRVAAYKQMQFAMSRCFMIQGVGGKEAEKFGREQASKIFKEDYSVMQWLDEHYRIPSYWKTADEDAFREEIKDAIESAATIENGEN
jgi:hypothetical protein